jgi:Flp pilus assembly protein TadG
MNPPARTIAQLPPISVGARPARTSIICSCASAQSMVELALMMPVLVLLLVVVTDMARAYAVRMALSYGVRAGAQYGAQNRANAVDYAGMEQAACNAMPQVSCTPGVTTMAASFCQCAGSSSPISCTNPGGCAIVQNFVKVDATSVFTTLVSYPGVPSPINMTATSVMQVQ